MEAIKDFESFYTIKIEPQLAELKKENRSAGRLGLWMFICILLTAACFIVTVVGSIEKAGGAILAVFFLVFSIMLVYQYTRTEDGYIDHFKKNVIGEVVNYLQPGMIYKPEGYVSSKEYKRSGLFRKRYDYYEGEDLLQGKYKEVGFYCSEVNTYRVRTRGYRYTIFKGLFFVAGVSKSFAAGTYVWPADEDQFARSLGEEGRMYDMPKVIELHLQHPSFEKYFCTCSTDPVEARRILTPAMMDMLIKFRLQLKRRISFSVVAGRCYVAIPIKEDLLEPSTDPADKEEIKKHFFTVLLVFSIINQLELNQLN